MARPWFPALLVSGLLCGCATTTVGKSLNLAVIGSGVADLVTTSAALERGGWEVNPLMRDEASRWVFKSLGVGAVMGGAWLYERHGHPLVAHGLRLMATALWSAVALSNARCCR